MTRLTSILILGLLAFGILINSARITMVQVNYLLYQAKITELFCVNKDKPELSCNGKCHLSKQIRELTSKDDYPARTAQLEELHLRYVPNKSCNWSLCVTASTVLQWSELASPGCVDGHLHSIWHPPKEARV